jgi:5'-methylthioadenosine phosphorylase
LSPTEVNYRANIYAMKMVGVERLISVSACGSLREELTPGTFVLVDQFIDRTVARQTTFFDGGIVAHVAFADPVCGRLVDAVALAADGAGVPVVRGGTYLAMEGPQFSTRAESELHRSWGCDVVGMTNLPEAKLAREAELCYASLAMVTDYDCWHPDEADVEVTDVVAVLNDNADRARSVIAGLGTRLLDRPVPCPAGCDRALDTAVITPREAWTDAATARLDAVAGRVLSSGGT